MDDFLVMIEGFNELHFLIILVQLVASFTDRLFQLLRMVVVCVLPCLELV